MIPCLLKKDELISERQSGAHVLLVEDNPAIACLASRLLCRPPVNLTVDHVDSGEAALAYLRQDYPYTGRPAPSLILLDLDLPGMDGHEVLRHVKRSPAWSDIPVVIFTSSDCIADQLAAERNGASGYLSKPLTCEEWSHVVKELRQRCSQPRAAGRAGSDLES